MESAAERLRSYSFIVRHLSFWNWSLIARHRGSMVRIPESFEGLRLRRKTKANLSL